MLLILAVVAISAVKGDGIISYAKNAKEQYSEAQNNDLIAINELTKFINNAVNGATGGSNTGEVTEETPKPGTGIVEVTPEIEVTASYICNVQVFTADGTKVRTQDSEINVIPRSKVESASDEAANSLVEAIDSIREGELQAAITNKKIDYMVTELSYIEFSGAAKSAVEQVGIHYELDYINSNISLGKIVYFAIYKDGVWTEPVKGTWNNNAVHVTLNDVAPIAVLVVK